jgi:DNA-binding response OmpR family regulator
VLRKGNVNGRRVLVCEGEQHFARLIQVNLERQGHEVEKTSTGAEALSKAACDSFDVAIIDTRLPDMTGDELMRTLRENPVTAHIRVILLGDKDDRSDDRPGPDFFVTKRPIP